MAKMSIVGLLLADNTIFDNMVLPNGVDHDLVVSNICNECYDLGVYQPDPDYMKFAIATWSRRKLWSWNKLYETLNFTYNPIWNKDGTITETETRETSGTDGGTLTTGGTVSNTGTITDDGDGTETGTIADNGSENVTRGSHTDRTYKQRGFNDSGLVANRSEEEQTDESVDTTNSNTRTLNTANTADNVRTLNTLETSNNTTTDSRTRAGSEDITRSRTEQGNIGVTTTQQMIQEERDISLFDLVDHITQDFKEQFCIMVY